MGTWTNPNVQQVTSLVSSGSLSGATNAATLASSASSYMPMNLVDVSLFQSYDINGYVYANPAGSVGAPLYALFQLQWFDDLVSGIPVFEEDWMIWTGRASQTTISPLAGTGPMHGRYMSLTITIPLATTGAVVQFLNVFGSGRTVPYSDWRQNTSLVQPESSGITYQGSTSGTGFDNVLADIDGITLGVGATIFVPCGLYSGPAWYRLRTGNQPAQDCSIATVLGSVSGGIVAGSGMPGIIIDLGEPNNVETTGIIFLPRAPVCFIIHGNATTGTSVGFKLIAQQAA
jgi:hypothetical protein